MKNEDDDLEIDDIITNLNKPKRIKSGRKGKVGEAGIVNDLNLRFAELLTKNPSFGNFNRSVGSGNRWGQKVNLSQNAIQVFSGDITTPPAFKFVIESKKGYNDIDLFDCFSGKNRGLDEFLKQVTDDSVRSGKKPLLIWRKDRKEKVAFLKMEFNGDTATGYGTVIHYKEWMGLTLNDLLKEPDEFFFEL